METRIISQETQADSLQDVQLQAGQVISPKALADSIVAQALAKPTAEEQKREERLKVLDATRVTTQTEVEPEQYALSVDGTGFFALGDLHGLKGKQKSGKSAVLKVCTAALLSGRQFRVKSEVTAPKVLFLDTEQQLADVKLILDEVRQMTQLQPEDIDRQLHLYALRRMSYDTLLEDTRLIISQLQPQVVFIDGLVDYVASFNDEVMSRQLIHELQVICTEYHCAIVCVLHENKAVDDVNMRGHLGTVLAQKAGTVLKCEKKLPGIITVSCPDARHGTMPSWSIRFDADGHLVDADAEHRQVLEAARRQKAEQRKAEKERAEQQRLDIAQAILGENGGGMPRNELTSKLEEPFKVKRSAVSKFITKMVADGKLFESGKFIMNSPQTTCPF